MFVRGLKGNINCCHAEERSKSVCWLSGWKWKWRACWGTKPGAGNRLIFVVIGSRFTAVCCWCLCVQTFFHSIWRRINYTTWETWIELCVCACARDLLRLSSLLSDAVHVSMLHVGGGLFSLLGYNSSSFHQHLVGWESALLGCHGDQMEVCVCGGPTNTSCSFSRSLLTGEDAVQLWP